MLVAFSIVNVLSCKANKNCYHSKKKILKKYKGKLCCRPNIHIFVSLVLYSLGHLACAGAIDGEDLMGTLSYKF